MAHTILWADDEIDLLKPHIIFLKARGYDLTTVNNGRDALKLAEERPFDLIILDENMPGLSGLETLQRIKEKNPQTPVIMITKSEEENIMDQAVGNKIADYLIKPVNPNQILLSIKKNLHGSELVTQRTAADYREEFMRISSKINDAGSIADWIELYKKLVFWELELASTDTAMDSMLSMQKDEANTAFSKYIRKNYVSWVKNFMRQDNPEERPLMSPDIFPRRVFPLLSAGEKVVFVLIDNFRLDQWSVVKPILSEMFTFDEEVYCAILPTATQYARNSIFSGLMPLDIARQFPNLWVDEDSEEGKNLNESPLIATQFERHRRQVKFSYTKINDATGGEHLIRDFANFANNNLNVVVFNFIDMMSHARTESKMMRELASSDAAYRSLTESWFRHSSILEFFRMVARKGYRVVLTTDHGTIRVDNAVKVIGERSTNTNLRYKVGRTLNYNPKQVFDIHNPAEAGLPSPNVSSAYIFAQGHDFFAYPNNYNYYVQYYNGTFQHGGVSMEEMLVPLITLSPK